MNENKGLEEVFLRLKVCEAGSMLIYKTYSV